MVKENTITFDDEEIIIRLKPKILDGYGWTGDLSINFEVFEGNPLNNEQYLALFKLAKMMASLPLFMEEDSQLMERVGALYDRIETKDEISGTITGTRPPVKASGREKKVRPLKGRGKVINIKDFMSK